MPVQELNRFDLRSLGGSRRICVISNASGSGKTTLARELSSRLALPYLELDSLYHQPNWVSAERDVFRAQVSEFIAQDAWVVDGGFLSVIGPLLLERADLIVWLDLPRRVWLPRLLQRTARRWWTQEELWNGNRENLREVLVGPDSLIRYAWRMHSRMKRELPTTLVPYRVVRLRSAAQVAALRSAAAAGGGTGPAAVRA